MTIPAIQPVDYVALCHALVEDESLHPDDTKEFRSLAELLGALREAVKGCGKHFWPDDPIGECDLCGEGGSLCDLCEASRDLVITDLIHTDQGGTHEDH